MKLQRLTRFEIVVKTQHNCVMKPTYNKKNSMDHCMHEVNKVEFDKVILKLNRRLDGGEKG